MSSEALNKLRGHTIVNSQDRRYPQFPPSINTTKYHIEIYNLIEEYVGLYEDLKNVKTPSSRQFMEKRMNEIKYELTKFWIVPNEDMVLPLRTSED